MLWVWIVGMLAAVGVLVYQRATVEVTVIGLGVLAVVLGLLTHPPLWAVWMIAGLWILFTLVFAVGPVRRWLISAKIMSALIKHLPRFSPTEQAALAAGNVGWEAELFGGVPELEKLINLSQTPLSTSELEFLAGPVTELCALIQPWTINRTQQIPVEIWQFLRGQGFFGLVIPEEYGGKGFSATAHAQIIMKIASVNTAVATIASVPNSLGPAELLMHYGTAEQKKHYLPRLALGEEIPCFALTSIVAGSDASAIADSGIVFRQLKDGRESLAIRLNWSKRYITLAPVATLLGLAFQLYDPEHLLGEEEKLGITCALIEVNTPGVHTGRCHLPLNSAFPNGPTQGVDVIVPLEVIIGGVSQAGKGWQMLMERLAAGRSISLPSITMGGIKVAALAGGAYARIRRQFNRPIGDFGGVAQQLAMIAGNAYIAEALRLFSVAEVDRGVHSATAAAICKYHVTEMGRQVITAAMNIHGGKGICQGPRNYLAQLHMESPIAITVEGANILTRCLIIFGQGVMRCHPFLLAEIQAARQNNLKTFDQNFFSHWRYFWGNLLRSFTLGLTNGRLISVPKNNSRHYYRQLSRYSTIMAVMVDSFLMIAGSGLKRQELLSARLGDLLSDLYMISAVLKYHQNRGDGVELVPLAEWACETLFSDFQQRIEALITNLPNFAARFLLRLVTFPLGAACRQPDDALTLRVAKSLLEPNLIRDCLGEGAYFGGILQDLETKLRLIIDAEPLLKKTNLSPAEMEQLQAAEALRMEIMTVDDFEKAYG